MLYVNYTLIKLENNVKMQIFIVLASQSSFLYIRTIISHNSIK